MNHLTSQLQTRFQCLRYDDLRAEVGELLPVRLIARPGAKRKVRPAVANLFDHLGGRALIIEGNDDRRTFLGTHRL